ncbi:MAG: DUF433 domain-containing protein [Anaerolineae bacterium]|nr:DUF433 domain-containing protein [Anaerolineae bacterium]NIN96201.1 DUF433 domain-containing protein [Anaerolineae bacterium]NIQ79225.1 DUF433 domain-containing protein [Anaerolineae bacterium]
MTTEIAPRIVVDPEVRFGKPVIQSTRVPVDYVMAKLAGSMKLEKIAQEYGITLEDIQAPPSYAASTLATEEVRTTA